ncbi:MAG: RIP metalloprotease RseP [Rhodobacteraceae bacterium]|nr:RIP metalloprotease RseP [Paracoccaceae bacterium]
MLDLIPAFGGFASTVIVFIVALSIIVAVHEYGHYIVGRWCGIHAEVFSIGFGPVLYSRPDKRGTVWQVAALPFGGYVKFLGDADAASGVDGDGMRTMDAEARARTMHGAALYKRALTVAAGPAANFLLSIAIFGLVAVFSGIATDRPVVAEMRLVAAQEGLTGPGALRPGDRILAIEGVETPDYPALLQASRDIAAVSVLRYVVERGGREIEVAGPFPMPALVDAVQPRSAAAAAGMRSGDLITAVDGRPIVAFRELQEIVTASEGQPLTLTIQRGDRRIESELTPRVVDLPRDGGGFEQRVLIGITGGLIFEPETRMPGAFEAVQIGAAQTWRIITASISGLVHMVQGAISTCNLQGPLGIAQTTGDAAQQGVESFIWFIAVLSAAIGLLNLFPIPVLDGGHLVFHAWEAVTGKPPAERVLQVLMTVGLVLILSLMLFGLSNDILCR